MGKGTGSTCARPAFVLDGGAMVADGPRPFRPASENPCFTGTIMRTTPSGDPLQIDLFSRIDDGIKEGWIVDLLEAHLPDGPAGYLKIAYVPTDQLHRWFPTAFEWAVRETGSYYPVERLLDEVPEERWTREEVTKALGACDGWLPGAREQEVSEQRAAASDEELRGLWRVRREEIAEKHDAAYHRFCDFHLDRPLVDYIGVYDERENSPFVDGAREETSERLGLDRRRRGLGTLLYETGALWMHRRGLSLHGSGIQSDEAGSAWSKFERLGLVDEVVTPERNRRVLDADRLLAQRPELDGVLAQFDRLEASADAQDRS